MTVSDFFINTKRMNKISFARLQVYKYVLRQTRINLEQKPNSDSKTDNIKNYKQ